MKELIYLDNSATTKPSDICIAEIEKSLKTNWGNPSALYEFGFQAEIGVGEARKKLASLIKAREDEVYFTSCGTESNNTAIFGAVKRGKKLGKKIVTTSIEHPSVLEPMALLEQEGFEVVRLKPDASGVVPEADIKNAIDKDTILVSIMLVNNETGAIEPIKAAASAIKETKSPALLHCDAVQAFGKIDIDVRALGIDMLSISGHKIHGPKGIGALYVKKGIKLKPYLLGGGQEKGFRSGTESTALIMGLSGALDELNDIKKNLQHIKSLNLKARELLSDIEDVVFNSDEQALPYILNISVLGYRSETLLHYLEREGICVSSGSACAKGKGSYVLLEMGLPQKRVDSALRISFSRYNNISDIEKLAIALETAKSTLRRSN